MVWAGSVGISCSTTKVSVAAPHRTPTTLQAGDDLPRRHFASHASCRTGSPSDGSIQTSCRCFRDQSGGLRVEAEVIGALRDELLHLVVEMLLLLDLRGGAIPFSGASMAGFDTQDMSLPGARFIESVEYSRVSTNGAGLFQYAARPS